MNKLAARHLVLSGPVDISFSFHQAAGGNDGETLPTISVLDAPFTVAGDIPLLPHLPQLDVALADILDWEEEGPCNATTLTLFSAMVAGDNSRLCRHANLACHSTTRLPYH